MSREHCQAAQVNNPHVVNEVLMGLSRGPPVDPPFPSSPSSADCTAPEAHNKGKNAGIPRMALQGRGGGGGGGGGGGLD